MEIEAEAEAAAAQHAAARPPRVAVREFQAAARSALPRVRARRLAQALAREAGRLEAQGALEAALGVAEAAIEQEGVLSEVGGEESRAGVLLVKASAALGLGRLALALGALDAAERAHKWRALPPRDEARMHQLRAFLMVLIGADALAIEGMAATQRALARLGDEETLPLLPAVVVTFAAADWHRTRRKAILKAHPEVGGLFETREPSARSALLLEALLVALCVEHLVAMHWAARAGPIAVVVLAATLGATTAYGFQALCHDLSHLKHNRGVNFLCMVVSTALCNFPWAMYYQVYHSIHHAHTGSDKDRDGDILFQPWHSPPRLRFRVVWPALWKSRVMLVRWSEYFEVPDDDDDGDGGGCGSGNPSQGYSCNPAEVVTPGQAPRQEPAENGTPVFSSQEAARRAAAREELLEPPLAVPVPKVTELDVDLAGRPTLRFIWSALAPTLLFPMFVCRKALLDSSHVLRVEYEGLMLLGHILCFRVGGWPALAYLWLSAMFSLGAFCHPFLGFWLIQHQNRKRVPQLMSHRALCSRLSMDHALQPQPQPTVSYEGPWLWHALNFGELWHVEHHDFPMIPALRYPELRQLAPEFYRDLTVSRSVMAEIMRWVSAPDDAEWMQRYGDFARRDALLDDRWVREYQHPLDTPEEAAALTHRLVTGSSAAAPRCGLCRQPVAARRSRVAEARACGCAFANVYHVACSRAMPPPPCEACEVTSGALLTRVCRAGHEDTCLALLPCADCCR